LTSTPLSPVSTDPPSLASVVVETPEFGTRTMDPLRPMPLWQKATNGFIIVAPFIAFIVAVVLLWHDFIGWTNVGIFLVGYVLTGVGITVGFHRLFTHRSFKTSNLLRYTFALLGSLAIEGDVIVWVADHRKHHQFSDREGDPHSPHTEEGGGPLATLRGFVHAHVGWMFSTVGRADKQRYAPDLLADPGLRLISRLFPVIAVMSFVLPMLAGYALTGTLRGALLGLLWGGFVRIFVLHHVTFSINSICHVWGKKRFRVSDESGNVAWLSIFSFGESWHHNHHAFPSSAFHGLKKWEIDPAGLLIAGLEKVGLVWDVTRIPPERQAAKELAA
jgi:stearoyl-CoA desaturase (delta-9 desaturase)